MLPTAFDLGCHIQKRLKVFPFARLTLKLKLISSTSDHCLKPCASATLSMNNSTADSCASSTVSCCFVAFRHDDITNPIRTQQEKEVHFFIFLAKDTNDVRIECKQYINFVRTNFQIW